jgi:Protein of unknown function (DUF3048) N-terminal domain/Protein of unknown function (DUF3048) C-terminal domain
MIDDLLPRRGEAPRGPGYIRRPVVNHALPHTAAHPFRGPNTVAAHEETQPATTTAGELLPQEPPKPKRSLKTWLKNLSKKQKILLGITAGVLVIAAGVGAYFLFFHDSKPPAKPIVRREEKPEPPPPTTVPSTLTGLEVDPSVNERPTTAIMIENSLDARPQAGLNQAGVVFEAIAEGGITRFIAIFQDSEPDYIGPVRSVRPYYIQWAMGFDAAIAHAGGSTQALNDLKAWGAKDLNHHNSYFWRVNNRVQPHNLYTSIAKLREYETSKGFGKANYTGFARKAEAPSAAPTAKGIDLNISTANFKVRYDYDQATNSYKRGVGGKAHTDEKSGAQLAPKVVIALILPQGKSGVYTTYQTIGSGQVYVFQDGIVNEGTWRKDGNGSQIIFTDMAGQPLKLNPGQTWITALGSASNMTYAP